MQGLLHALLGAPEAVTSWVDAAFDPAWNHAHIGPIFLGIALVLLLSGVGLPLPEDIPLTLAGFTAYKQAGNQVVASELVMVFVAVTIPILIGDMFAYTLGRKLGLRVRERVPLFRRMLPPQRMAQAERWFHHYHSFTVFLGRQVAGVRFVTFFTAGAMRVPLSRFVLFDFLGCLVSVPVWLTLGILASSYGEEWLRSAAKSTGLIFSLVAAVGFVTLLLVARRRRASPAATEPGLVGAPAGAPAAAGGLADAALPRAAAAERSATVDVVAVNDERPSVERAAGKPL